MYSKAQSPSIWEKIFVVFGFLLLAEAFMPIMPGWQLIRMLFFAGVGIVYAMNFEKVTQGLLKVPYILGLVGLAGMSYLWSERPSETFTRMVAMIAALIFASYFATCFKERDRFQILAWFAGICIIASAVFIFALPAYGLQNGSLWRGVFAQKNGFGRAMVIVALIAITYPSEDSWRIRILRLLTYVVALYFTFMSDSMTSVVLLLSLTLMSFALRAFWLGRLPGIAFTAAAAVPIAVLLFLAFTVNTDDILIALGRNPTLTGRTDIWTRLDYAISQEPLLGYGYGGFWKNWTGTYGDLWSPYDNFRPGSAHNTYYNLIIEMGYTGLVIFTVGSFFLCLKAIHYLITQQTTMSLWPILYIAFMLATGFSEDFILFNSIGWGLYMSVAIAISVRDATAVSTEKQPRRITGLYPTVSRMEIMNTPILSKE